MAKAKPTTDSKNLGPLKQFHWEPQPRAQALVNDLIAGFLARCPEAGLLADRMKHDTGTRFGDWVDSIETPMTPSLRTHLLDVGFSLRAEPGAFNCFVHEGAIFPRVVLLEGHTGRGGGGGAGGARALPVRVAIKVESVADFVAASRIPDTNPIEGEPVSQYRRALVYRTPQAGELGAAELWAVERHGYRGFEVAAPDPPDPRKAMLALKHSEAFRRRQREFTRDEEGFEHVSALIDAAAADLGVDWTCDLFFGAEREYWQRRNRAGQVQKARQDRLGLGWANHDHHTYRSSREHFTRLIGVLEKLGLRCRERFYAGAEAGWGAQVLEQPVTGIVIFADVDMSPQEVQGDFAHEGGVGGALKPQKEPGTVGLWCGLHGEACLQAGMHHLEAVFDFDSLRDHLRSASINTMAPFTNFPYLRQAFTEGERWPVSELRLVRLVQSGRLTSAQAHRFRMEGGAIGSHLENLERNDGYKGFNQQGVSQIIAKTDPRKVGELVGA